MFDAIKERRHFNLRRLRDMAANEGLEIRRLTSEGEFRPRICFLIAEEGREKGRRAIIHESPSVPRAWEFFRGWLAGRRWGHEVAKGRPSARGNTGEMRRGRIHRPPFVCAGRSRRGDRI
jgi:hypothetical protein